MSKLQIHLSIHITSALNQDTKRRAVREDPERTSKKKLVEILLRVAYLSFTNSKYFHFVVHGR